MTNEELIQKIKAEIERLKKDAHLNKWEYSKIGNFDLAGSCSGGEAMACEILSFLDALEPEKPMNQRGFEEEMDKYVEENGLVNCSEIVPIARHFYEIGCRRTAEKYDEIEYNRQRAEENIPNDLEEAAKKHFKQEWNENYWAFEGDAINTFIAGAKWDREQMISALKNDGDLPLEFIDKFHEIDRTAFQNGQADMKRLMMEEAVEGEITKDNRGNNVIRAGVLNNGFEIGDKVRIIILKKEDEK